ncbi:immunity protein Imm33 domain-containing protein [Flavobacterium lindanitolerans]|uniref:Imm33-like domain-containing protein n=1 Tax=Flavobacterium lindanitolerans TaxID=428988 RepID=A0A497UXD7_9FLAO|nr:hypothetical protein [Flavobacterium lindanitolerans]PKW29036.1 hypothetical protein B0G92_0665 [Flavobacterium lindanitolerans]RLJ35462.1 hypothetical protein CLV50_0841 [Flavobacterium lindanitolerans]
MLEVFKGKVIKFADPYYITEGLSNDMDSEIRVKKGNFKEEHYIYVLKYIIEYIMQENAKILPDQNIGFNSWILNFILKQNEYLEIYETHPVTQELVQGCDYSLEVMNNQIKVCDKHSSKYLFTRVNQNIAISDGVLEGVAVEGVRYEAPEHMSGWYLTTDLYNDDINSLKQIRLPDLARRRPELIKYLALDNGFRFFVDSKNDEVWFDEEVLD